MKTFALKCLFLLLIIFSITWHFDIAAMASPLEKKLYEAAKKEGVVEYWDSLSLKEINILGKGFRDKYPGIKIKYFEATSDVREEKYLAEHRAGRHTADVMPLDIYRKFKEMDLLTNIKDIINDTGYPKKFCSKDLDAAAIEHLLIGTAYNTNLVPPKIAPQSWEDLLDPKWKGKINVERRLKYFVFGTGYWGEEKIVDYLSKLRAQKPTFTKGVSSTLALLVAGEFPISVGMYFSEIVKLKEKGAPIEWASFSPIVDKLTPFMIMRHAPHPNAAKLFLHYWMSPEGASYLDSVRRKGNPEPGSGTQTSKILAKMGSPYIYPVPSWIQLDQKAILKKYQMAVGYAKAKDAKKKK